MDDAQILVGIAEVAVGVAGFSGVVFVLAPSERRTAVDVAVLIGMLANALGAVVMALSGIAVAALLEPDPQRWGWASALAMGLMVLLVPPTLLLTERLIGPEGGIDVRLRLLWGVMGAGIFIAHALNIPLLPYASFGLFFTGCGLSVILSITQFVVLVLGLVTDD